GSRTSGSAWSRTLLLCGCARADVREVLSHSHFSEEYRALESVINWCAAAFSPVALYIVRGVIGAHLLAVAIHAAVSSVKMRAALEHSRLWLRINVCSFLIGFRIEMADLPVGDDRETHPREGKRAEDSKEKWNETFHQWPPDGSASTGFRKVGTVDVRPNPKSIKPK